MDLFHFLSYFVFNFNEFTYFIFKRFFFTILIINKYTSFWVWFYKHVILYQSLLKLMEIINVIDCVTNSISTSVKTKTFQYTFHHTLSRNGPYILCGFCNYTCTSSLSFTLFSRLYVLIKDRMDLSENPIILPYLFIKNC